MLQRLTWRLTDWATYHFRLQRTRTYDCRKNRSSVPSGPPPHLVTKTLQTTLVSCSGRRFVYSYSAVLREKVALWGKFTSAVFHLWQSRLDQNRVPAGSRAPVQWQPVPWVCHRGRQRLEGRGVFIPLKACGASLTQGLKKEATKKARSTKVATCDSSP